MTGQVLVFMEEASEGDGTSQEVTTKECSAARSENENHPKLRAPGAWGPATAWLVRAAGEQGRLWSLGGCV